MPFRLNPSTRRVGENQVIMAPEVIVPDQCRELVRLAEALPAADGRVEEGGVAPAYRTSTIRWIPRESVFVSLYEAIATAIFNLNQAYFGYDLTVVENMQFTTYVGEAKGFYEWHMDTGLNPPTDIARKLSLTVQLSDPAGYEGGDLELWADRGPLIARKEQGLGILFPSPTLHRVQPVVRGTRHSLVAWARGPRFR